MATDFEQQAGKPSMTSRRSTLSFFTPPKIKRRHLRKYSWLPDVLRISGSVIPRVLGPVITMTIITTIIAYAWHRGTKIVLTNSVVPLLSVVVGLILVFRNSTSYDRFWEGRKAFAQMTSSVRNLSRLIWVNVSLPPTDAQPSTAKGKTPTTEMTSQQLRKRKIECLRLCAAFVVAVKHYVRDEGGTDWEDYEGLLPRSYGQSKEIRHNAHREGEDATAMYAATLTGEPSLLSRASDATKRVRVKRSKPHMSGSTRTQPSLAASGATTPLLSGSHRTLDFHPFAHDASIPLPLIIAHDISRTIFSFRREGCLETVGPAGVNAMASLVQSLVDQMTVTERIANTPIPVSYSIHLKQVVTLYLLALPFTLVNELGWGTIPLVTVLAFTFMGIEGIADEIEMPFGHDKADLPLDTYCHDLREEVEYICEHLLEGGTGGYGCDDGEGDD